MEIIALVPMLILVFAGIVLLFITATALFPVVLVTILVMLARRAAVARQQRRGKSDHHPLLVRRRIEQAWRHLFPHRTVSH